MQHEISFNNYNNFYYFFSKKSPGYTTIKNKS